MNLSLIKNLLSTNKLQFVCSASWPKSDKTLINNIVHQVEAALTKEQIDLLEVNHGELGELKELFLNYGSLKLYCDEFNQEPAFVISNPKEWPKLDYFVQNWINSLSDDERLDLLPCWIENCIVIGEISSSDNYFLYITEGEFMGNVFQFVHDGFEFIKWGDNLESFINKLCTVNKSLLDEISINSRYTDGHTNTQWFPEQFQYKT